MSLAVPKSWKLAKALGPMGTGFVSYALQAVERLLPQIEASPLRKWDGTSTEVHWADSHHRQLNAQTSLTYGEMTFGFKFSLKRRTVTLAVPVAQRAIDLRERDICLAVLQELADSVRAVVTPETLERFEPAFDERVVARHLARQFDLNLDLSALFRALRELSEESYENKALTFACVLDGSRSTLPVSGATFPSTYLSRKRYKALSDGYKTAYLVSSAGAVLGLEGLENRPTSAPARSFFPEWTRRLAVMAQGRRLAVCLTRQGDLMVFYDSSLRFTYRFGRWQHWNHTHLVRLLATRARAQRVAPAQVASVVGALYRASLDVSFRRSGALFVLLRNRLHIGDLVQEDDRIGSPSRSVLDKAFDASLQGALAHTMPREVLVELASLDGAVVIANDGTLLAYGAVLEPARKGKRGREEGSRTKAAVGASFNGLAIKVSSDGAITVFSEGTRFLDVG